MSKLNLFVILIAFAVTNVFSMSKPQIFWNALYASDKNLIETILQQDKYLLHLQRHPDNKLPLQFAADSGYLAIAQILIKYEAPDKEDALFSAAKRGHIKVSKLLLENGVSINCSKRTEERMYSPLNIAISRGHYKYVACLLKKGADCFCVESPLYSWARLYSKCYYGSSKRKTKSDKLLHLLLEWRKAPLTLCCCLHPRCGAKSPFRFINQLLVQEIVTYLWPEVIKQKSSAKQCVS